MTTRGRDTAHGTTPQDVLLLHPDTLEVHPCRVGVSRRGLLLRRLPDRPSRTARRGALLRVPWWTVQGFSADEVDTAPDGGTVQVVEVVTDAGTLSLLVPAPEVSVLLARVGRWSGRWGRARRAPAAAVARRAAIVGAGLRPVVAPCRRVGTGLAAVLGTVLLWSAVAARAAGRAAWRPLAAAARPLAAAARPVLRPVGRATAPARRWVARSAVGLALAASWRRGRVVSAKVLGTDRPGARFRPVLAAVLSLALLAGAGYAVTGGGSPDAGLPRAGASQDTGNGTFDSSGMARMLQEQQHQKPIHLPQATTAPAPAPPSLADAPPLSPHEVFGFAPYWTLTQSTGFDVTGMTTIAYFSIGVNPNGTLDESGSGWDGYQSQDLADLVTRAHAAGVRVVLTVNCFDQGALDQLTSSPTAPTTLSAALLQAVEAKNLDGVNLDFEGEGSGDQAGLTNLVSKVSTALHAANPHYQVTMDTYASSAGDSAGFYDIPALAPWVDGFFVMAYQLNLEGSPTPSSPLTSSMFSDLTTAQQYAAAVTPSKVIMGLPYYGYSWPTDNGTMAAQPTGGATPVTYAQVMAGGHPSYWDPVTDTAWTSYQVGSQWYEDYYEDPASLYMATQLSQTFGLGGVGIWALGMDGNDPQMMAALDGNAPATKAGPAGPAATSPSGAGAGSGAASGSGAAGPGASGSGAAAGTAGSTATTAAGGSTTTTAPAKPGGTTTTTTAPPTTTTSPPSGGSGGTGTGGTGTGGTGGTIGTPAGTSFTYTGTWKTQAVTLTLLKTPKPTPKTSATAQLVGTLTDFHTTNPTPALACLSTPATPGTGLSVWKVAASSTEYEVVASKPTNCTTAVLTFPVPSTTAHVTTAGGSTSSTSAGPVASVATAATAAPTSSGGSAGSAGSTGSSAGAADAPAARVDTPAAVPLTTGSTGGTPATT
jgi:spore germination protein YaaH